MNYPSCGITLKGQETSILGVELRYYDDLRDRLDRGETGWIELDSRLAGGKCFIRLENIVDLFYAPPGYCDLRNAEESAANLR